MFDCQVYAWLILTVGTSYLVITQRGFLGLLWYYSHSLRSGNPPVFTVPLHTSSTLRFLLSPPFLHETIIMNILFPEIRTILLMTRESTKHANTSNDRPFTRYATVLHHFPMHVRWGMAVSRNCSPCTHNVCPRHSRVSKDYNLRPSCTGITLQRMDQSEHTVVLQSRMDQSERKATPIGGPRGIIASIRSSNHEKMASLWLWRQ